MDYVKKISASTLLHKLQRKGRRLEWKKTISLHVDQKHYHKCKNNNHLVGPRANNP